MHNTVISITTNRLRSAASQQTQTAQCSITTNTDCAVQHHNKHRLRSATSQQTQAAQCSITTNTDCAVQHHNKHRLRSATSQQTQTAQCSATEIELFILLFADDLTLLACAVIGLQNQLNALSAAAKRLIKSNLCYNEFEQVWLFGCGNDKIFFNELKERYSFFCY